MIRLLAIMPLHILSAIAYTVIAYSYGIHWFNENVLAITMASGAPLRMTGGELMIFVAGFFLMLEGIKAASTTWISITNHALSTLLFILSFGVMITMAPFGTGTWAVITLLMFCDMLMGVTITILSARRDFGVGEGLFG